MAVHKRGTVAGANVIHRLLEGGIADQRIGAVEFRKMKVRETLDQFADVAARGADLDRNRDSVFVVLDHEQHRQLEIRGRIQRLPKLAFAGGTISAGDEDYLVTLKG